MLKTNTRLLAHTNMHDVFSSYYKFVDAGYAMLLIDCPCMLLCACAMFLSIFLMAGRAHHYDL
jgi:hypothetical protein